MSLRTGETLLQFPSENPVPPDLSRFDRLEPFPGEYWAVLDPPRSSVAGGAFQLRVMGDGWRDRHTEQLEAAERDWEAKQADALHRIEVYRKDPSSSSAKMMAMMAAEVALASYNHMQRCAEPEAPGSGLELRPDSYTVVRVGEGVPLAPLDRVIVAPYAARRQKRLFGVPDVCLIGLDDPWADVTILRRNAPSILDLGDAPLPAPNEWWEPVDNWCAIALYRWTDAVERVGSRWINAGRILMAGPDAECEEEDDVVLHRDRTVGRPDDQRWFVPRMSPFPPGVVFVREVDGDGVRRVLAKLNSPGRA